MRMVVQLGLDVVGLVFEYSAVISVNYSGMRGMISMRVLLA